MPPGPDFKFYFFRVLWYDPDEDRYCEAMWWADVGWQGDVEVNPQNKNIASVSIPSGTSLRFEWWINNKGDEAGYAAIRISKFEDYQWKDFYREQSPNEISAGGSWHDSASDIITVDKDTSLRALACHYDPSRDIDYIHHESGLLTVYVEEVVETCLQTLRVVDEDGNPIEGAKVTIYMAGDCYTDENGECQLYLLKNHEYTARVSRSGYEDATKSFIACKGVVEITLKEKPGPPPPPVECEPAENCDDGKIEESKCEIPRGSAPGDTVTLRIVVDNTSYNAWHRTKYRLKIRHEWDGSEWVSEEFVLGGWGEHTVSHDVTIPDLPVGSKLRVRCTVQRCCGGRWEDCPHPDATKTFEMKVFESWEAKGRIVDYNAPARLKEGEFLTGRIQVLMENVGASSGEFRVFLIDRDTGEEIDHQPHGYWKDLEPGERWSTKLPRRTPPIPYEMPDHDLNLRLAVRREGVPTNDDEEDFTIELARAFGEIVDYDAPEKVPPDSDFTVTALVKNTGYDVGEFRVFLVDAETGTVLEKEPDTYWKNLDPGEEWSVSLKAKSGKTDMKLRLEVRQQKTPDKADDYEEFTVAVKKPKGKVVAVDCPTTVTPGEKFTLTATIKNEGDFPGEFRIYVFDNESGERLGKEPDTYWKNLDPGGTYTADFSIRAPYEVGKWSVRVEARKQITPESPDDAQVVEIEVGSFGIVECLFPRLLRGDMFPRIGLEGVRPLPRLMCIAERVRRGFPKV
mgnify:CR=1 FL=1